MRRDVGVQAGSTPRSFWSVSRCGLREMSQGGRRVGLGASSPWAGPSLLHTPFWLPGQFLACAHLEAVVSSCWAGLRLRSGLAAHAWRPPRAPQTSPQSREGRPRGKEKNRIWAGVGWGGVRTFFFLSEEPFGFSYKSETPGSSGDCFYSSHAHV